MRILRVISLTYAFKKVKSWHLLPFEFLKDKRQSGQAIVEYVLLLVVMTSITWGFVIFMNRNLSKYWSASINLIVNDKAEVKTVKFK